jgi:hypothetical protein
MTLRRMARQQFCLFDCPWTPYNALLTAGWVSRKALSILHSRLALSVAPKVT